MKKFKLALYALLALTLVGCSTNKVEKKALIALAWKPGLGSESMNEVLSFLEKTGSDVIMLEKTTSSDLSYYEDGTLSDDYLNWDFSLNEEAVTILKGTENINVDERINDVDLLIFLGGEDVSPSLYTEDFELMDDPTYNPERDASDYLLMRYALSNDIPTLGICRGMQMMYVVNGGTLIQDLPLFLEELGEEDVYLHRSENGKKTFHSITIEDKELKKIIKCGIVSSSHHQAVSNELPNNVIPVAYTGHIIEAIKLKDHKNALGVQFHPEYFNSPVMEKEGVELIKSLIK